MRGADIIALIPARAGSKRIRGKNIRPLLGHPLIGYAIAAAQEADIFSRIIVSTDSEEYADIARGYGADVPFLRPFEMASSTSPDIEWILHALGNIGTVHDAFAIVRTTSPLRRGEAIRRAWAQLQSCPEADSLRAVERVRQHPGKMWVVEDDERTMRPLLDQSQLKVPWHCSQYQSLPVVYVQNSSLEIAWVDAVRATGTNSGRTLSPFFTSEVEGIALDYEDEWERVEALVRQNPALLPALNVRD